MSNSTVRFTVCVWAALLATVLEISGVTVAGGQSLTVLMASSSAQHQLIGSSKEAALR